jgi:hypothetical protein
MEVTGPAARVYVQVPPSIGEVGTLAIGGGGCLATES